jgi:mannitol/fructose-specific phosphotransferase system IIA component
MTTPLATEILRPSAVLVGASASDKAAAIDRVGGVLVAEGLVTDEYVRAMHQREAIISTYLGNGIALPHGTGENQESILRTGLAVVQFPAGVPWGDEPARLVIGLAAKSEEHIPILSRLAGVLEDAELCERLAGTTDPLEIHRTVQPRAGLRRRPRRAGSVERCESRTHLACMRGRLRRSSSCSWTSTPTSRSSPVTAAPTRPASPS